MLTRLKVFVGVPTEYMSYFLLCENIRVRMGYGVISDSLVIFFFVPTVGTYSFYSSLKVRVCVSEMSMSTIFLT